MEEHQKAYVAGIIDSEGSIELLFKKCRKYRCRIKMCDDIVIPTISKWIGKDFNNPESKGLIIEISKNDSVRILTECYDYLYLKQPRAKLFLTAANIRRECTNLYTEEETELWNNCFEKLKIFNKRGKTDFVDNEPREHKFHWAWLAGLIDGDGSIIINRWKIGKRIIEKPTIQLSLTNHKTVDYVANILELNSKNHSDKREYRKQPKRIRIMPTNLIHIVPKILPYLTFKKELAQLALDICLLRQEMPNGQYNHKNVAVVKNKIEKMKLLNQNKYIH